MTELNIPAIAGAAFLGFLALAALLFLFAPVTRFLGDLFCCPWRVPFTRKRRRNGDEEVDKEDLPYLAERRLSSVDGTANKSMPADYVTARNSCEHETAGDTFRDYTRRMKYTEDGQEVDNDYYGGPYGGSYSDPQAPFPQSHGGDWWRSRSDEYSEYMEQATHRYHTGHYYSDEETYGYDKETLSGAEIQRPQPSYSPSEMATDQYSADYFPWVHNEYYSQYRTY